MTGFAQFFVDQLHNFNKRDVICVRYKLKGFSDALTVKFRRQSMVESVITKQLLDFVKNKKITDPAEVNEFCKIRFTAWARLKIDGSEYQRNSISKRYGVEVLEWIDLVESGDEKANAELIFCTQYFVALKRVEILSPAQERSRKFRQLYVEEHPEPDLSDEQKQKLIDQWNPSMVYEKTALPIKEAAITFFNYGLLFMDFSEISKGAKYRFEFSL